MELVIWIKILEEVVGISLHTNALVKNMNPFLLHPAMSKYYYLPILSRLGSLALIRQPVYVKESTEFKPVIPCWTELI